MSPARSRKAAVASTSERTPSMTWGSEFAKGVQGSLSAPLTQHGIERDGLPSLAEKTAWPNKRASASQE